MSKDRVLLRGATLYDGSGGPPRQADLGIVGDTLTFDLSRNEARTIIDMSGLAIAPGFIDVHGHSEFALLAHPEAEGKLLQGITTEINGNCGLSAAPLLGAALSQREPDLNEYRIDKRWGTLGEYMGILEAHPPSLNFATLAGQGNIRASALGYEDRPPTAAETAAMLGLLKESLEAGAIGVSTGLIYPPGTFTPEDEIARLLRAGVEHARARGRPFLYATHMRSEGKRLIEAIGETLRIGRASGAPVHVSHLKTSGRDSWGKIDEAIALLEAARREGMALTCDRYPYTAGSTDLDAVLPAWCYEGGAGEELKRLRDPAARARIEAELGASGVEWDSIQIASVASLENRPLEGARLGSAAKAAGSKPERFLMDLLLEEGLRVGAVFHGMSEENLARILALPFAMIGSDSTVRPMVGPGKPHPRGFGSMPRFLARYAPDLSAGMAAGIAKITSLPARTFGLARRGMIAEGCRADLVAFDPEALSDTATYENPYSAPTGIGFVFVNGLAVVEDGRHTGLLPGRVLRHGQDTAGA